MSRSVQGQEARKALGRARRQRQQAERNQIIVQRASHASRARTQRVPRDTSRDPR